MSEAISREAAFEAVADKALRLIDEAITRCEPTEYAVLQKLAAALVDLHTVLGLKKDQLDREEQHEKIMKLRLATKEEAEKAGGGVILIPCQDGGGVADPDPEPDPEAFDSWLAAMADSEE